MESRTDTRLVKKSDLKELKKIWTLCFGDEDDFIDFNFQSRDWMREAAVLELDGRVVSMLTMIPVDLIGEDGEKCRAAMLYAIATHPDFQKRGLADRLIEFSNRRLLLKQIPVTLLVPATEELFHFYGKRGYQDVFFVREAVLQREEIESLAGSVRTGKPEPPPRQVQAAGINPLPRPAQESGTNPAFQPAQANGSKPLPRPAELIEFAVPCRITPAEPAVYNSMRRELLKGYPYLDYRDEEISFEKQLARMSGTDIYFIEIDGAEGCAYAERISQEEVIVKELLIPGQYLAAALKQISELLPGEKYIVRTPSWSGEILGGEVRPFGMLRINGNDRGLSNSADHGTSIAAFYPAGSGSWLGIAFD